MTTAEKETTEKTPATKVAKPKSVKPKSKQKTKVKNKMFVELDRVLDQISRDKNIPKPKLIEAIEHAFLSAARKKWGHLGELEAHYSEENGEIELFQFKTVVEEITDLNTQMTLKEAQELDPDVQGGDSIGVKMDSSEFGRIAAQAAKQVIITKVRDAERDLIYNEYKDRVGELVTGIVRRYEKGDLVIDLGRSEASIPRTEQVPTEHYKMGDRVQAYCGIYAFGKGVRRRHRAAGGILLRADVDHADALVQGALDDLAPVVLERREVRVGVGVEIFHRSGFAREERFRHIKVFYRLLNLYGRRGHKNL